VTYAYVIDKPSDEDSMSPGGCAGFEITHASYPSKETLDYDMEMYDQYSSKETGAPGVFSTAGSGSCQIVLRCDHSL
jgi:hypothetical protein